ncbi:MAG: FAD-binding protein [Chthoniobacteraceae bacterium]
MTPRTLAELSDAVRAAPRVLAVGARTKPRLSQTDDGVVLVDMRGLSGIIEYDPSEFTFTALAGTPLSEVAAALAEHGQYLPFDPPLAKAGATLGGTVAAGLSGPGRFRYGGLRDFIIGVQFVDGTGRVLRMGGKVVKNAAGFDLPKFFVGSLGRFGVLAELTFKVFPCPSATRTLKLPVTSISAAQLVMIAAARARWELDALDYASAGNAVFMRLRAPAPALEALIVEILSRWPGESLGDETAAAFWSRVSEFSWAESFPVLAKLIVTPARLAELDGLCAHVSAGGNVAFVAAESAERIAVAGARGLFLRGENAPLWLGPSPDDPTLRRVKCALDPEKKFPDL